MREHCSDHFDIIEAFVTTAFTRRKTGEISVIVLASLKARFGTMSNSFHCMYRFLTPHFG